MDNTLDFLIECYRIDFAETEGQFYDYDQKVYRNAERLFIKNCLSEIKTIRENPQHYYDVMELREYLIKNTP